MNVDADDFCSSGVFTVKELEQSLVENNAVLDELNLEILSLKNDTEVLEEELAEHTQ
jgi:hypothetical protein